MRGYFKNEKILQNKAQQICNKSSRKEKKRKLTFGNFRKSNRFLKFPFSVLGYFLRFAVEYGFFEYVRDFDYLDFIVLKGQFSVTGDFTVKLFVLGFLHTRHAD